MGSDWGEFWRRIPRFSWFGHQSLFDLIPTFVVPCMTGHFASVDKVCSFLTIQNHTPRDVFVAVARSVERYR
jgi:hypothetical protein